MVSLFTFLDLDIDQKAEYVWQGTFVANRTDYGNRVLLYHLGEFYAEVFYDGESNEITFIKGFRSIGNLAPYIGILKPNVDQSF